jgi:hypothetical protein
VQHTFVYALLPHVSAQIPLMPTINMRHTVGDRLSFADKTAHIRDIMPGWLAQMPANIPKFVQARWVLLYDNEPVVGADPMRLFERGRHDVRRYIQMLRPAARRLRQMGLKIDAVFLDNEGGFHFFRGPEMMRRIFASARARSKMPPSIRSIPVEKLSWGDQRFDPAAGIAWNRWVQSLDIRAMREIFITSRLFHAVRTPGAAPTPPIVMNFNWMFPGWTIYDYNGWPFPASTPIDGRSSNWGVYFPSTGQRYRNRAHHPLWNVLVDQINYARSVLSTPGASFYPTILQPSRVNHWIFEQMIAHYARTGVNWTASRSAYVYFNEFEHMAAASDPVLLAMLARHDEPFPVLPNLPELEMDCDRIETAGFVTTYEDFIANVLEPLTSAQPVGEPAPIPERFAPRTPMLASLAAA